MVPEQLKPRLELVREEYVLIQAWKKTASYIRYHNWFSDTLALDRTAVNLPAFIGRTPRTSAVFGELAKRSPAHRSGAQEPALASAGRRVGAGQGSAIGTASTARPRQPGRPGGGDGADALSRRPCRGRCKGIRGSRYVIRSREGRWSPTATGCSVTR